MIGFKEPILQGTRYRPGPQNPMIRTFFCKICQVSISCDKKGYQAMEQHANTTKHKENARIKLDINQMILVKREPKKSNQPETSHVEPQIQVASTRDSATKAEILWCLKTVLSDWSAASCQGIPAIFQEMFPGTASLSFTLSPSKLGYLMTEGLGPYFRELLVKDCSAAWYTLIHDETTNTESKKELQIAIRYWSSTVEEVVVYHLETYFLGQAKAEDVEKCIQSALNNAGLPNRRLLMLGSDGPNVNKKIFRLVDENVKMIRDKGLMNIGTCNIHIAHNAFLKGLQELGNNVSQLAIQVFYYFDGWPKRSEDYRKTQEKCGVECHRFIKHVPSRWLTLHGAASRLLEQWDAMCEYFLKEVPKQKSTQHLQTTKHGNDVATTLKNPTLKAEICFVIDSAEMLQSFTKKFQSREPLIHVIYDELKTLFLTISGRICKTSVLDKVLYEHHPFAKENLVPVAHTVCNIQVQENLKKLPELDRLHFLKNAQNHYTQIAKHLLEKSCLSIGTVAKHFRCLQPEMIKNESSIRSIQKIAETLPIDISSTRLVDEWKILMTEKLPFDKSQRIDHFWREIINLKTALSNPKYPTIGEMVKAVLSLSHGSADIERGFSSSGRVLTEERTAMSLKTLNARLYIKDGMKRFQNRPELVPITSQLLLAARGAHQKYKLYLQDEAIKKEKQATKLRQEAAEIVKKRALEEEMESSRKKVKVLEEDFAKADREVAEQKKLADTLFKEANDRLEAAIAQKDMQEVQLAQSMLQSVKYLREEENKRNKKKKDIYKKLEAKKSYLISKATRN